MSSLLLYTKILIYIYIGNYTLATDTIMHYYSVIVK